MTAPHAQEDDLVLPFQAERAEAHGRIIRLGEAVDTILGRHNYPDPVAKLLGEAVALTSLLGTALKFDGKFILQTKTDGPVNFLIVDYETPGKIRGYASFNENRLKEIEGTAEADPASVLGNGHLALTIDRGPDMDRYQGIVPLEGQTLEEAAHIYFRQSEQIPTYIRLAVAKHFAKSDGPEPGGWSWRAGGLMIQNLSSEGGKPPVEDETGGAIDPLGSDDENWTRVRTLAQTVEDHELLDPLLASERLLFRLFHEENIRTFTSSKLEVHCSCSRDRIEELLQQFSPTDLNDMIVEGDIVVTCEFCNSAYNFKASDYIKN